jgi:hypothetical protein
MTTSASQLEAHFRIVQESKIEEFPENQDILDQPACQQIVPHENVPDDFSPNADTEVGMMLTFAYSGRIIPHPEATFWTLNTPSYVKHASSALPILYK